MSFHVPSNVLLTLYDQRDNYHQAQEKILQAKAAAVITRFLPIYPYIFYLCRTYMSNVGILLFPSHKKDTTVTLHKLTFLRGHIYTSFFYNFSTSFIVCQYKPLFRAEIASVNLTLLLYLFLGRLMICSPQTYRPHNLPECIVEKVFFLI